MQGLLGFMGLVDFLLVEKKLYKSDFGNLMRDPQHKPFIDKVIEPLVGVVS